MPYKDPQKQLEHNRRWRAENPEKSRAATRRWAENNPDKVYAKGKRWAEKYPEKKRAATKKYYDKYPEKVKAKVKAWRKSNPDKVKLWQQNNPDKSYAATKKWEKLNPEKRIVINAKRRARRANAKGNFTVDEFKDICSKQHNKCKYCNTKSTLTIDHVIPLSKGGNHEKSNIVGACSSCNSSKKDLSVKEYIIKLSTKNFRD